MRSGDILAVGGDSDLVSAVENLPSGFLPEFAFGVYSAEHVSSQNLFVITGPRRFPITPPPGAKLIPGLANAFSYRGLNYQFVFEDGDGSRIS